MRYVTIWKEKSDLVFPNKIILRGKKIKAIAKYVLG